MTVFSRRCASRGVLEDVAGKWGILALVALADSDHRFNALRRRVDGVSEKMLSQTLQTLERDGLVVREVCTTIPPRVQYSLTALGREVAVRLRGLTDLLESAAGDVLAARAACDRRRGAAVTDATNRTGTTGTTATTDVRLDTDTTEVTS